MSPNYKELSKELIDKKDFVKYGKLFLEDLLKNNLKGTIKLDKIGIGSGPILMLESTHFVLKIFSSSFGSSDLLGSCFVMIQPICPDMPEPYDLGFVIRHSLAYYANNPHFLVDHVKRAKNENRLWEKVKPFMLKEKHIKDPEKYYPTIEKAFDNFSSVLNDTDFVGMNRLDIYWNKLKNLYLTTKQKLINDKTIKCKYTDRPNNYDFIPLKHFGNFAEKQGCKVFGATRKYFYNKKTQILYCAETPASEIKFIYMKKSIYEKYYKKLKASDFKLHSKLYTGCSILFLKTTRIYIH